MKPQSRRGRKWRRLSRKNEVRVFVGVIIVAIVALVGLVMWMLTSVDWRMRY